MYRNRHNTRGSRIVDGRTKRMKISRWFGAVLVVSICLLVVYYNIEANRGLYIPYSYSEKPFTFILRQTIHGKYCLEENICKNSTVETVYNYIRLANFSDLFDADYVNISSQSKNLGMRVPKIVHYTWYGNPRNHNTFRFHHMMAVLSVHKFIQPSRIYFWHDTIPDGDYWTEVTEKVPELCLVYRGLPANMYGINATVVENFSSVVRLEAMLEYGGIYLDLDVMVVKQLDHLLAYDVVMGYETSLQLGSRIIISKPWEEFLQLWYEEYTSGNYSNWENNTEENLADLAKHHPHLIHTVNESFYRPNRRELDKLYEVGTLYDWRENNFMCNLWIKHHNIEHSAEDIKTWNTTVGEIWRWIYYGEWRLPLSSSVPSVCIYGNICKTSGQGKVWKYYRRDDFMDKMDAEIDYNASVINSERVIPNIVHFTWYGGPKRDRTQFRFHHVLGILAVHKFIKPKRILFWHDMIPEGYYWKEVNERVPEITLVYRKVGNKIRGKDLFLPEHLSDIVRLEAIIEYGGMYFDLDVMVLKPFDPLFRFDVTMGYEMSYGLCNGLIIGKPWAYFLRLWHQQYKSFNDKEWAVHSVLVPARLAKKYPNLIHTEEKSMHRPNWKETSQIYDEGKLYDWRKNNYAMHMWIRRSKIEHNATVIRTLNTTAGEIFRHILYDDWRIIK